MSRETAPLLLSKNVPAAGESVLRDAVVSVELASEKNGLGQFASSTADLRAAAAMAAGFFAARRSSEVAQLLPTDAVVNETEGATIVHATEQQDDQLGVGRQAYVVSIPAWGDACPVTAFAGRPWSRD